MFFYLVLLGFFELESSFGSRLLVTDVARQFFP